MRVAHQHRIAGTPPLDNTHNMRLRRKNKKNGFQGGQPLNLETLLMLRRRRRGSVSQ